MRKTKKSEPAIKTWNAAEVSQLRKELGVTQVRFAVIAGVSVFTIHSWENLGTDGNQRRIPTATSRVVLDSLENEARITASWKAG